MDGRCQLKTSLALESSDCFGLRGNAPRPKAPELRPCCARSSKQAIIPPYSRRRPPVTPSYGYVAAYGCAITREASDPGTKPAPSDRLGFPERTEVHLNTIRLHELTFCLEKGQSGALKKGKFVMPIIGLPPIANLDHLKHQAKDLIKARASRDAQAAQRIRSEEHT